MGTNARVGEVDPTLPGSAGRLDCHRGRGTRAVLARGRTHALLAVVPEPFERFFNLLVVVAMVVGLALGVVYLLVRVIRAAWLG